jgi:hypothetical protein
MVQTRRHLELLALSKPLRRYASTLQPDENASAFLVHKALSAAFSEEPGERAGASLEASLRADIDRRFASGDDQGRSASPCAGAPGA